MNVLTGRRRYRDSEHGLILEVEICYWDFPRWCCGWRDADRYDVFDVELV